MLLRSSSTPVLGSLIPDTSGHHHNHHHHPSELATPTHHPKFKKFFFGPRKISCNSSPSSPSVSEVSGKGFRKVLSEGNLEVLEFPDRELKLALPVNGGLETIPSFSYRGSRAGYGLAESEEEEEEEEEIDGAGTEMCLVTVNGAGDAGSDCGGGGGYRPVDFYSGGGDSHGFNMEDHYKKMLEENPSNPLFLRNYAQFLYQTKGDAKRAEEYYSRAILADPSDGEVLSQYAKLVWELHHDAQRATTYFQCAVQASSHDSHVHAAFAKFLWEVDDDDEDEEDEASNKAHQVMTTIQPGPVPSAAAC
ncbi:unnamed protein product [Cuscuta campestris]|uniref:TmcB/TmcC TPR repeats domain-containing protein n=1 Tax=Cuscuta campestris TaxID=132261 RepID=A0A484NLV2_9ASTE|nr:unnamed protein product [Cuscuta campestris]